MESSNEKIRAGLWANYYVGDQARHWEQWVAKKLIYGATVKSGLAGSNWK